MSNFHEEWMPVIRHPLTATLGIVLISMMLGRLLEPFLGH